MMDIKPPIYHDFRNYQLDDKEHFFRCWEISVPKTDSFEWSVVMSYLVSANFRDDEDFKARLITLGCDLNYFQEIKKSISKFNPFLNRFSIFFEKHMQEIVKTFKNKNLKAEVDGTGANIEESSRNLKAAIGVLYKNDDGGIEFSKWFQSFIYSEDNGDRSFKDNEASNHLTKGDGEKPTMHFVKDQSIEPRIANEVKLTLYCSKSKKAPKFHFGLKKDKAVELKKGAFFKILKQTGIIKTSRKDLYDLQNERESLVISIIKSNRRNLVPDLYKSFYHSWKLSEAGFEMDPKVIDQDGFSAFYHALSSGEEKIFHGLYNYAVNVFRYEEKTVRNPDKDILDNLKNIKAVISSDIDKCCGIENTSQVVRDNGNQLIRFTEFLHAVCEQIMQERDTSAEEQTVEAVQRKNVILSILQMYDTFFYFDKSETSELLSLNKHIIHENYYRNLDRLTTLFFFDNIFLLKERIQFVTDAYLKIESSFFLCVLTHKYFSSEIFESNFFLIKQSSSEKSFKKFIQNKFLSSHLKFVVLLKRLDLRREIHNFMDCLKKEIVSSSVLQRIPEEEVKKSLANLPEVKDELMMCRLQYYLKTALRQSVSSEKQSLIVERALQVLGETLIYGSRDRKSLCFLLSISIPEDTFRLLKNTRNDLSHLKEYTFTPKLKAENMLELFTKILLELKTIFESMQGIFDMQQFRLVDFVLQQGRKEMEDNISETERRGLKLSQNELSDALEYLTDTIHELHSLPWYQPKILSNPHILKNLSRVTNKMMQNEKWEEPLMESVENLLWPLNYLLPYLSQDSDRHSSRIKEIKRLSEQIINASSKEMREKLEDFWGHYKKLIDDIESSTNCQHQAIGTNIKKFRNILRGFKYLTKAEKIEIFSQIPEGIHEAVKARNETLACLQSGRTPLPEQLSQFITQFLTKSKQKKLKEISSTAFEGMLRIIEEADDPIKDLNSLFEGSCTAMSQQKLDKLCKHMNFTEEIKEKLSTLNVGQKHVASENELGILINRIRLLREILIDERQEIQELWNKGQNIRTKQYARYKVVQRFVHDADVQASAEMLLFDCMILLGNQTEIERLWIKASNSYSGINLRNVIGHGNPTLEIIGKVLDPEDLPSVFVDEMLKLISDEEACRAIKEFCEVTESEFSEFHRLMNDEEYSDHPETRARIVACPRWKRYSTLLPHKNVKSKLSFNISHQGSTDCEECDRNFET